MWKALILFAVVTANAFAAFDKRSQGSPALMLGGTTMASSSDPWASTMNPALLQLHDDRILAVSYAPQPFGLKELSQGSVLYIEPASFGHLSLSGSRFGFDLYREVNFALSYAATISSGMHVGVALNYYGLAIQNYGNASTFGVDLGGVLEITDDVRWGFAATNINFPKLGEAQEPLPQVFATGIAYEPFDVGVIAVDIVKDVRYAPELVFSLEYAIVESVRLRTGVCTEPSVLNAGVGLSFEFIRLDYGFSSTADLGLTHQASLIFFLNQL